MKYSPREYARALYDLIERATESASEETVKKFVKALAANGDLSQAEMIVEEFEKVWRRRRGEEKIEVAAARREDALPLGEKLKGEIFFKEDPKVLGGVKIRIGDKLIDNTIRARINRLKESLGV